MTLEARERTTNHEPSPQANMKRKANYFSFCGSEMPRVCGISLIGISLVIATRETASASRHTFKQGIQSSARPPARLTKQHSRKHFLASCEQTMNSPCIPVLVHVTFCWEIKRATKYTNCVTRAQRSQRRLPTVEAPLGALRPRDKTQLDEKMILQTVN